MIVAGLEAVTKDDSAIGYEDLAVAMSRAGLRAFEELYWLTLLPAEILKTPAPDDDERKAEEERTNRAPRSAGGGAR